MAWSAPVLDIRSGDRADVIGWLDDLRLQRVQRDDALLGGGHRGMGVPVITLVGPMAVSRAGLCQASNLGLSKLVAQSSHEFVAIASELANDLVSLNELRSTLRARMERSLLMDAPMFAANIEAAYRSMWYK